ncbi:LysR family transcriptional regulator [Chromohalobacter sp. 48-RD10]|uniref:LysR family transcriptional regulator n=1 Tax=Chromohalobacter sp. 48-RD10 TaxID=2994063 RepID=UPI0024694E8C|nr:LysR family transcriptional regulator [Chromohalobacter sp. 48-RD10]
MDELLTFRLFIATVESGSLSAAAHQQGMALSSASHRLKRLEQRLGVTLLNRTTRVLSLTEEGAAFLQGCREAVAAMEQAEDRMHRRQAALSGEIVVTAPHDLGERRIGPALLAFQRRHPRVSLELHLSDGLSRGVGRGIDLAIRVGPLPDSALIGVPLGDDERRVVASPDYWGRRGRPAHPRDLLEHDCLVLTRDGEPQLPWRFQEGGRALSVPVSGSLRSNSGALLRRWAMEGAGVILKSSGDIREALAEGTLESVLDDFMPLSSGMHALMARDRYRPQRLEALVAWLKQWFREADGEGRRG